MTEHETPHPSDAEDAVVYATDPTQGSTERDRDNWPDHTDPEWLKLHYKIMGRSQRELAEIADVATDTISYHMDKHGIETRDRAKATSMALGGDPKLWDEDWIREQYQDHSTTEIADKVGMTQSAVLSALDRFGIEPRTRSEGVSLAREKELRNRDYNDPEWLYREYATLGKSIRDIADENEWAEMTVLRKLHQHGIRVRSATAAALNRRKREKCPPRESGDRQLVSSKGIDASWRDIQDRDQGCYLEYRDRTWLKAQLESGNSLREIADNCNVDVDPTTIMRWVRRFGLDDSPD